MVDILDELYEQLGIAHTPMTKKEYYKHWREVNKEKVQADNKKRWKEWKENNPEKYKEKIKRDYANSHKHKEKKLKHKKEYELNKRYGLTSEQLLRLQIEQNNRCAICCEEKKLNVDHNHNTGRIRALLCVNCNIMIGQAKEDVNKLYKAIEYLEKWNR